MRTRSPSLYKSLRASQGGLHPTTMDVKHSVDEKAARDALPAPHQAQTQPRPAKRRFRKTWAAGLFFVVYCATSYTVKSHVCHKDLAEHSWAFNAARTNTHLTSGKIEALFLYVVAFSIYTCISSAFLRSVPDEASALAASREYATHPHIAASTEDYEDAKVILKLFQDEFDIPPPKDLPVFPAGTEASRSATLGINKLTKPTAWIDTYYPIMNSPLDRSLQIIGSDGSVVWDADLVEDGDPGDPEAAKYRDAVPTFHGLSRDGDVQGQLIYANYGRKEDYEELVAKGVDFTGKIVITRYGAIFRGLKVLGFLSSSRATADLCVVDRGSAERWSSGSPDLL